MARFHVTRRYNSVYARCTGLPLSTSFRTEDETALAGHDYVETTGQVEFAPGQTNTTISVPLLANPEFEGEETFLVRISLNVSAWTLTGTARITEAQLLSVQLDASDVALTAIASVGRSFAVEASPDLKSWIEVEGLSEIMGTGQPLSLRHVGGAQAGAYFYRLRLRQ